MHERMKCGRGWMLPAGLAAILLSACAKPGASVTEATICRELRADAPSYSERDTPETLAAGARFFGTFDAVCPDGSAGRD